MFTKVLIADDIDFNDLGAAQILNELDVEEVQYAKYCDEALLKIKKAALDNQPYQLLISDLSFKADHNKNQLNSGEELIQAVRAIYPDIKIIVFSIEDRFHRIKLLFEELQVNGYVLKGRNTMYDLKIAIQKAFNNQSENISAELQHLFQDKTTSEINNYDVLLIKNLSIGISQESMETVFKEAGITPNSKSSIEKHINKLKIYFKANNTVHLVSIAKDLGII
ncbi:MAG: response regulator [Flavobacteriaceae bacterium]|uniref:Response regulator transcription factor n=1 Tax=Flavobacterium kayseriense TaxID=2764714 RepID=A0ABR7JAI6_9FLAO|nr:response regulator transcription factor [Flavobacterium kayseriense]MBC5842546.1 response regulator transcription factor [Flavobacterium kayseriense]MBC5849076.1 response regulator transcription factor [Flavobacterium kayseriense]MBU0942441.1 response regulator [Bacteroidota bacterium]MBX9886644.1 response regulator [Flavobacteriaceae bacterium]